MTQQPDRAPRTTEDLQFKPGPGGAPRYASTASGPVDAYVVRTGGTVLGYLWASDLEHAAGFVRRPDAGDAGGNAGSYWVRRLLDAKRHGLTPSQAVELLAREAGGQQVGRAEGAMLRLDGLDTLRSRAGGVDA
jgi:hypothetical protein